MIYLNDDYLYNFRTLYDNFGVWEGLFIDIPGPALTRPLTVGNIYRPPHDNNTNENISKFTAEFRP